MLTGPCARTAAIATLFGVLLVMTVWFGSLPPNSETNSFPSQDDLAGEYNQYVGEKAVVSGEVVTTDPLVIETKPQNRDPFHLTVRGVSEPVERGETLRVFGVVEEGQTIRAINAFTTPQHGRWYAWIASFVAGLWALSRLLRHWRFNRDGAGFEPRPSNRATSGRAREQRSTREETDA